MNPEQFVSKLNEQNIQLNAYQIEQFDKYFQILVEWNKKMNLTSLISQSDVYLKHFFDSISIVFYVNMKKITTICDVGAGAGFPSIPLKICYPHLEITIVDSLKKRIGFLSHLVDELELDHITLEHSRAEDAGRNKRHREKYDLVTARAVARMSVLSELCLPFCKQNGQFIAMKGANFDKELQEGKKAISTLGGDIDKVHTFTLPAEHSERSIVIINKKRKTPNQYPRQAGTPNRNPIS